MASLGVRPRPARPERLGAFRILHGRGRFYAVPDFLDPLEKRDPWLLSTHPATLSAATWDELQERIRDFDAEVYQARQLGGFDGYNLIQKGDAVFAVPKTAGQVDVNLAEERRRTAAIQGHSREEVEEHLRRLKEARTVEFAGGLPIFLSTANCGRHPQFMHTAEPPPGYWFTSSAPRPKTDLNRWDKFLLWLLKRLVRIGKAVGSLVWMILVIFGFGPRVGLLARLRTFAAAVRMYFQLRRGGGRRGAVLSFIRSRHYTSQLLLGNHRGLVFLPSMPYTFGQNPWMIEVEDPTTLFHPHIQNGATCGLNIKESPYYSIVKTLLESDQCKGVITHIRSTARMITTLFGSDKIARKVFYAPLGVQLPARWQRHDGDPRTEEIHLLFINSWHQQTSNFFVRGGLDVLEAFAILHERYPQLRLTIRTNLPPLDPHYHRLVENGWVRVIHRFFEPDEMDALLSGSHIFLLPAARVHIVSLLQAMSYGLAVVASDGWGMEEYVTHERNGLIVKGRYGKVSWVDEETGFLREDYDSIFTADPVIVQGLVDSISRLVEDHELRRRLGRTARADVQNTYNLDNWNRGLKAALDAAMDS
jgi:glycosyltransferase involved in cell wall biosynthesis